MSAPIKKYKLRGVEIAVWAGKFGPNFTIQKSYKDKASGEYKSTSSLDASDLAVLAQLISVAVAESLNNKEPAKEGGFDNDSVPF